MATPTADLNVLFVCTGNICRSPLAEQLFDQLAKQAKLSTKVKSAGVHALTGEQMHPNSQEAMRQINFTPKEHASQQLTQTLTNQADLIITATKEHANSTAQIDPAASKKIFTLKELARISKYLEQNQELPKPKQPIEKLNLAFQYRGYAPRANQSEDIIDPWGRSFETYIEVTNQTHENIEQIINWLAAK